MNKHTGRKAILIASTETGTDGLLGFTCRSGSAASAVFVFLLSHQPERCHNRPPNREWQTQMQTQKQMQTHMHARTHTHTLTNPHKLTHIHSSAFAGTLIKREARTCRSTRTRTRTHTHTPTDALTFASATASAFAFESASTPNGARMQMCHAHAHKGARSSTGQPGSRNTSRLRSCP